MDSSRGYRPEGFQIGTSAGSCLIMLLLSSTPLYSTGEGGGEGREGGGREGGWEGVGGREGKGKGEGGRGGGGEGGREGGGDIWVSGGN